MSGEISVISRTQQIVVEPATSTISVINASPQGALGALLVIPPGGTTGQVLMKLSDADNDFAWVTLPQGA